MKFLFDNNLSPYLAKALDALCAHEGVAVEHLRRMFPEDISDVEWIERLAKEGEWAVITQDRLMRNRLEKEAFRRSGLTAFVLTKAWASHRYWEKAAQLVRWWPRIMEQAGLVEGGAAFEVPWRFSGKGKFKALRL